MDDKYISLLLERCLNFDKAKSLFISYDVINSDFVNKLVDKAKSMGIDDIALDGEDINIVIEKLNNESIEEIENDSYFDKSLWNEYALKDAAFLMLETEFPGFLDNVDQDKVIKMTEVKKKSREIFRKRESNMEIPWCIAAYPNKYWADHIFKGSEDSYQKLYDVIMSICMIDKDNPVDSWNKHLDTVKMLSTRMNELQIKKMHYKNSLGTDLTVELPDNLIWNSAAEDKVLVNMPSYEIFTSPHYLKTEGIVYNSRPLIYGGALIDNFYIKFKEGKVVEYDAEIGKDVLGSIINYDSNSCYLGEVALVNYDSPISNTGLVFGTTLIDENASCHIALGDGFKEAIENGFDMSDEEILERGVNRSKQHVDFMIGTKDLEITAETNQGEILLFKEGNFNI